MRYTEQILVPTEQLKEALAVLEAAGIATKKRPHYTEFISLVESESVFASVEEEFLSLTEEQEALLSSIPKEVGVDSFCGYLQKSSLFEDNGEQINQAFFEWLDLVNKETYARCSFYLKEELIEESLGGLSESELVKIGERELAKIQKLLPFDPITYLQEAEYEDGELRLFAHLYSTVQSMLIDGQVIQCWWDIHNVAKTSFQIIDEQQDGLTYQLYSVELQSL